MSSSVVPSSSSSAGQSWNALADQVLNGEPLSHDQAMSILLSSDDDLLEVLEASVDGNLNSIELKWRPETAVCVVMASGGYPQKYEKGKVISGLADANARTDTKVFHAGTKNVDGSVVTNGGRVLGVTAWRVGLTEARAAAYEAVGKIDFEAAHVRSDIAAKALA